MEEDDDDDDDYLHESQSCYTDFSKSVNVIYNFAVLCMPKISALCTSSAGAVEVHFLTALKCCCYLLTFERYPSYFVPVWVICCSG
jgi:cephalosporin-C deacetylase-like acetyl esterase